MADDLFFITWENGMSDWVQKQHIEPLFKEILSRGIYDLDWQGQIISFDAKEIEIQWTTPSF